MPYAEKLHFIDSQPELFDNLKVTPFDYHYVYQSVWAHEHIHTSKPQFHFDIGSQIQFIATLAVHIPVYFYDIRPVVASFNQVYGIAGNALQLPFNDGSIKSISCLHVAEHIGLGRYGDELNPRGTILVCDEISRVLAKGGNLYFSLPVGKPRVCFNAHRIHTVESIISYFPHLNLNEFSLVTDSGEFQSNAQLKTADSQNYACGLFWFTK